MLRSVGDERWTAAMTSSFYLSDMTTQPEKKKDPLHGVTLERMVTELSEHFGWKTMGERIKVRCFTSDPSVASSLKFLRKTPWAREKVESMYLFMLREKARNARASSPATSEE
jgi:uncharacterized protein (DUF2132 family)